MAHVILGHSSAPGLGPKHCTTEAQRITSVTFEIWELPKIRGPNLNSKQQGYCLKDPQFMDTAISET